MRTYPTTPDLIPVVLKFLDDNLTYHVAEDLTGWTYPEEWVTVNPSGGLIFNFKTGEVRFDVNTFALTKQKANQIAREVTTLLLQMLNYRHTDGTVVTSISCTYPADISDPLTGKPRFVFDCTVSYRIS